MKNSKLRRILLLLACAVLLVSLSVGATLAYLTSTTQTVKNTFTVGAVNITLDEEEVDEYGKPLNPSKRTTTGNQYKLLPGHTYTKDPTVTVLKGSEECYVRIKVTVTNEGNLMAALPEFTHEDDELGKYFNLAALVDGWDGTQWLFEKISGNVYEFRYASVVDARNEEKKLPALFTAIKIPGHLNENQLAMLKDVKIDVQAHAVQADGFNGDVNAAWTAFDGQKK